MNEQILSELQTLIEQEVENFATNLEKMESAVKYFMTSLGKELLQRLVDCKPNGYQGSSTVCQCGNTMKFVQHRKRNIHTIFGWITVKRAYYHCTNCGRGFAPYDRDSGLGSEQLSSGLAKACCLLAVDDSFEQVSRKIEALFGQLVCDDTVKEVVHNVGSVVLQQQAQDGESFFFFFQIPSPQANPKRLYVSVDGTTVHEEDAWHEVKIGCIYWEDQQLNRISRYVGRFDSSENFGWHVWFEACRCGFREAKEVIYIGDGAPWIRTEHRRHFGKATFIIDWFHASEYLWDCSKKLFGEGTEATEKWVKNDWIGFGMAGRRSCLMI